MQTGVVTAEVVDFGVLYGFGELLGGEFDVVVDAGEVFDGVEDEGCARAEEG